MSDTNVPDHLPSQQVRVALLLMVDSIMVIGTAIYATAGLLPNRVQRDSIRQGLAAIEQTCGELRRRTNPGGDGR